MRKNLAYFTLLIVGLISFLTLNTIAQEKVSAGKKQSQKADVENSIVQNYIKTSSFPTDERRKFFSNLSAEDKANLFKLHLTLQLVKRPNLTKDQKDIILESISTIAPDTYDRTKDRTPTANFAQSIKARAGTVFSPQEVFEIFATLGGNREDIAMLQKYQDITVSPFRVKRRQDFSKLSPQEKSNTMKTHLILQMAEKSLSKRQLEFILEVLPSVSPELYSAKKGTTERSQFDASLNSLSERVLDFFQKEEAVRIFVSLGGEEGFESTNSATVSAKSLPTPTTTARFEKTNSAAGLCSCATNDDYCGWWHRGATCGGGGPCEVTLGGCGFLLGEDCNGQCSL